MKVKVYVCAATYEGTRVLNEKDFQELKDKGIWDMIEDDNEFAEWLNDNYTPREVYTTPDEDIHQAWREACAKDWEYNDGEDWEEFEIEI